MKNRIVVIGGGPGGYTAAIRAAQLGGEVTLIEQTNLGGTCLNQGCIPSKFLKKSCDILGSFQKGKTFGLELEGSCTFNMENHVEQQQQLIDSQAKGIEKLVQANGIARIPGKAVVKDDQHITITDTENQITDLEWDKLIIAVGSTPLSIGAFPFDHQTILSSTDILRMQEVPKSLAIIGGGVIGCEFGSIFSSLGTKVTIIEAMDRLLPLPSLDTEISKNLQREMKKKKISINTSCMVSEVTVEDGETNISFQNRKNNKEQTITAEKVLVSIGRASGSTGLGLENIGVICDEHGWIKADSQMRTDNENVFAIGDVLGPSRVMLAHVAATEGEVAAENCMGENRSMEYNLIPNAIFTQPEISSVGLTEEQAREQTGSAESTSVLFRSLGKAHASGEIAGCAKLVFNSDTGQILGAHLIGSRSTDIIAQASISIATGQTVKELADIIHAHPTFSEIMMEAAKKAIGQPIHG